MASTLDQVELIQGEVIDQSNIVFDAMKALADDATNQALNADLSVDTSGIPTAPVYTTVDLTPADFAAAINYLDQLYQDLLTPPVYPAAFSETGYVDSLLTALRNLLYSDLVNGGYGIDATDEENLWNRAREREIRGMQSQQDNATRQFALAGFPMPTGAAQKALQQIQQDSSEKIAQANRDIAIKRADMYVENRKFAMATTNDLEKTLMANFNAKIERELKQWEVNVTAVTEDYKIRSQTYAAISNAYTDLYKSNADLAQAQAQLAVGDINAKVAIYRAEMDKVFETAKLDLESKKTAASIYMSLAAAAMSAMNVNTSMSADGNATQSFQGQVQESTSHNYNY